MRGGVRPPPFGMGLARPGPYDRGDRFNGPIGLMGMGMMGPPMAPFPGRGRGRNKGMYLGKKSVKMLLSNVMNIEQS